MAKTLHVFWNNQRSLSSEHERTLKVFYGRIPARYGRRGKDAPFYYEEDLDQMLNKIADEESDVSWCVVHSVGSLVADQIKIINLFDDLIDRQKEPFLVIGQLIDKKGFYCGIHEQTFLVSMDTYRAIGRPAFGEYVSSKKTLANYSAGPSIHDDYTPTYVRPEPGESEYATWTCGWGFVDASLRNGLPIYNIPNEIRENKLFFYPDDNAQILNSAVEAVYNFPIPDNVSQRKYLAYLFLKKMGLTVKNDRPSPLSFIERSAGVFLYNTEILNPDPDWVRRNGKPLDVYVGACAGFLDMTNLFLFGIKPNTRIIYYDVNRLAVEFKKFMWENFDGDLSKLPDLYSAYIAKHPKVHFIIPYTQEESISRIITIFGSAEVFRQFWLKVRELPKDYHQANLFFDSEKIFKKLNKDESIFWSISDIFLGGNEVLFGIDQVYAFYRNFISRAAEYKNLVVQGKSPDDKFIINFADKM